MAKGDDGAAPAGVDQTDCYGHGCWHGKGRGRMHGCVVGCKHGRDGRQALAQRRTVASAGPDQQDQISSSRANMVVNQQVWIGRTGSAGLPGLCRVCTSQASHTRHTCDMCDVFFPTSG
eukprot:365595-Chlamydomonas_euryale.AAC.12